MSDEQESRIQKPSSEAAYSPEMKRERDNLVSKLDETRSKVEDLEKAGLLPEGVYITRPEEGKTQILFGPAYTGDLVADLKVRQEHKAANGTTDFMVIDFDDLERMIADSSIPNGKPVVAVTRNFTDTDNNETVQILSFLNNGYVQRATSKTGTRLVHRTDADELTRRFAAPTERVSVAVEPHTSSPAELGDILHEQQELLRIIGQYGLS